MPKNRAAAERQIAEEMRAGGVRLDLDEFPQPLMVSQATEPGANTIASCYLIKGWIGTAITLYLDITRRPGGPFMICDFSLSLPWRATPVTLLPDPAGDFAQEIYRFSEYDDVQFGRSQMIQQSGTLRSGQRISGFLMGRHEDPLEDDLAQGAIVRAELYITDQFDQTCTYDLKLQVDRKAERSPKPPPAVQRRRLLDLPDVRIHD